MKPIISLCLAAGWLASIGWLAEGMAVSTTRLVTWESAAQKPARLIAITAQRPARPRAALYRTPLSSPRRQAPGTPPVLTPMIRNWPQPSRAEYWAPIPGRLPSPKIFIVPDQPKLKAIGPVRAATDADGRFSFDAPDMTFKSLDGLPARRQGFLLATHEGFAPDWMTTWGHHPDAWRGQHTPVKQAEYTLRLAKNDVTIHGTLLDPDGGRLARVRSPAHGTDGAEEVRSERDISKKSPM